MTDTPRWLGEQDIIVPAFWMKTDDEIEGSTLDICWVKNIETRKRALFKPDPVDNDAAYREYVTYKVAAFLGISCATIEVGSLLGRFGCISYDCNTERRHRISDGDSLYRCDKLFNDKKSDSNNTIYDSPIEISFRGLLPYVTKDTEIDLVKMMFLDCLMLNPDRHGGNYSFYINKQRAISGLMPLYDHGLCMRADLRDVSLFPYEGRTEPSFIDLFRSIRKDYPEFINGMMSKVFSADFAVLLKKLECYDFIMGRANRFTG